MRLLTNIDSTHAQPFQNKAKLGMAWCIGYCVEGPSKVGDTIKRKHCKGPALGLRET